MWGLVRGVLVCGCRFGEDGFAVLFLIFTVMVMVLRDLSFGCLFLADVYHWALPVGASWKDFPFEVAVDSADFKPVAVGEAFGPTWATHWFKVCCVLSCKSQLNDSLLFSAGCRYGSG